MNERIIHCESALRSCRRISSFSYSIRTLGLRRLPCRIAETGGIANVWAELSHVESMGLSDGAAGDGDDHFVFGSHSPFLYFKAVQAKLACSPGGFEQTLDASYANAQTLISNNHR